MSQPNLTQESPVSKHAAREAIADRAFHDRALVFNSVGHLWGIDRRYRFSPAYMTGDNIWSFTARDKAEQRKVHNLLSTVYEPIFQQLETSHSYRKKHSPQTAIERLKLLANQGVAGEICLLKCDIKKCFDNIPHSSLEGFLDRRVTCGNVRKPIRRFLRNRGIVSPKTFIKDSHHGVFAGSVLGPILSNIFLHYALDQWFVDTFPEYGLVRYADDFLIITPKTNANDSGGILGEVSKRFLSFGMIFNHPKTQIKILGKGDDMKFVGFDVDQHLCE